MCWIFSFKPERLGQIVGVAHRTVLLDHHKTAEETLKDIGKKYEPELHIEFDMNRSGGQMTWDHFTRNDEDNWSTKTPWIVSYTQDRDLWKWELPYSKEINAALSSYPQTFAIWDELAMVKSNQFIQEGQAILRYQQQLIERIYKHRYKSSVDKVECLSVNSPVFQSELGEMLTEESGTFGDVWYYAETGKYRHSFRSTKIDVSEIAKKLGGGGHKNSAGCEI